MKNPEYKNHIDYLAIQPEPIRSRLEMLDNCIKKAAPQAEELISYQMPAFKFHGMLAYYAAFKNHYSIFVAPEVLNTFIDSLKTYTTTKSAIHFPFDEALPEDLIHDIIKYAVQRNLEKMLLKEASKKKTTNK